MQVETLGGQLAAAGAREEQREADVARLEEELQQVRRGWDQLSSRKSSCWQFHLRSFHLPGPLCN